MPERLGTEFGRRDGVDKASGRSRYTDDLASVPGTLHAAIARSEVSAGRLLAVDVDAARAFPGVVDVVTASDAPATLQGLFVADEPLLAVDRVRYRGEPIALVVAETRRAARAAALLVSPTIEAEPAVLTLEAAMAPDAVEVHAGQPNYTESSSITRGDVDAVFADAAHVVCTIVDSHRVHQTFIEPRAAVAEFSEGRLQVTCTTQAPFEVRSGLSSLFGLPMSQVGVRVPTLGGGFGGKLHLGMAAFASLLAMRTEQRVSLLCSREEEFLSPAPRENSHIELESAVGFDGSVLARRARVVLDSGAYAYDTPPIGSVAALQACGPYRADHVRIEAGYVHTHTVPTGSYRGPSGPQMSYAVEKHMNDIAERVGISFEAVREINALRDGDLGPTGHEMRDPAMATVLARARAYLEQWRAEAGPTDAGRLRGFGLGCAIWTVSPIGGSVAVTMNEDATATVLTGATEIGTGAVSETLAAIVADGLGIEPAAVHISSGDTDRGSYDHGSQGSRTLYGVGTALVSAVDQVRDILVQRFADDAEAAVEDCEVVDGKIAIRGVTGSEKALREVIGSAMGVSGPVAANGRFQPAAVPHDPGCVSGWVGAFNEPTFHAHVAQVEVDLATGVIEVQRYAAIHDTGPVLNPQGARGQVHGGVVQGLGYALTEEISADGDGRILNPNLHDYRVPTILDVPDQIDVSFVTEHPGSHGYRGIKGIGEAPAVPGAAAIGTALRDAVGRQPATCSLSAERVLRMLEHEGETDVA
ncbi:xanthine dehydrogenase family protein [Nocardioides cavernae]|uniref:Xanthine dehydrogenase family protein n=1 Tax=Nocardioides cavernae TaxID=1921566 RepID=A0ABR8NCN0_9ACTN|nr:xanthine dehydrogenase family protein molybdopterin-binding subunit [Nocardioides cavernae]MBD3924229.1 xanthine dehydrogenase family protein [Nocardioides cavernae]MBM7510832.1 CO/xanthine dehydrogenase Mo-binding subunit [Nocardioides cavernae]